MSRVFFTLDPLPPIYCIRSATLLQGLPGDRPSPVGPMYLGGFLTPESRDRYIARTGDVVVAEFDGKVPK